MKRAAAIVALAVVLAACGGSDQPSTAATTTKSTTKPTTTTTTLASTTTTTAAPSTTAAPTTTARPAAQPNLGAVRLRFTKVGSFDQPLAMTWCPGNGQPYVAEKTGKVRTLAGATVLDLSSNVSNGNEQGLLGIACSLDGKRFYASYTNRDGDSRLDEFPMGPTIDRGRGRNVLSIDQPAANHNGGNIIFGPDKKLWYGLGDGGGADDQFNNAQKTTDLLGDMLRLDPTSTARPEVVITGLRNPWRYSFDRATGDLWIGDVGQGTIEEVDKLSAGKIVGSNMGWPAFEGTNRFRKDVAAPPGAIPPVFQYDHSQGQSIVGGYVYRGTAIPALVGAYLFADTYTAHLRAIVVQGTKTVAHRDLGAVPGGLVSSFAQGPGGELYVLSLGGGAYRLDPG